MIINKLKNISLYDKNIPHEAIDFVSNLSQGIDLGRHEISDGVYANVEKYITKPLSSGKFEAHKDYIDIQLLIRGREKIYYSDKESLTVSEPYDKDRDIMFFSNNIEGAPFVNLDGTNFALIYPHEAHAPQIMSDSEQEVLKVVVKVKI